MKFGKRGIQFSRVRLNEVFEKTIQNLTHLTFGFHGNIRRPITGMSNKYIISL